MDEDRDHRQEAEGPLSSEALARDDWRGDGGTKLHQADAPGHTLPESERDRAAEGESGGGASSGIVPPPD